MELNDLRQLVKDKGGRMTPKRELIFSKLIENVNLLVSAEDLLHLCREEMPSINLTTIYRNLEYMEELGLVHQLNMGNAKRGYKLVTLEKHHHHLICTGCGKTINIDYCPVSNELLEIAKQNNFTVANCNIDFLGKCADCQ